MVVGEPPVGVQAGPHGGERVPARVARSQRLGALEVPLLGRVVKAREVVNVKKADADRLLEQSSNWQAVPAEKEKKQ